MYTAKSIIMIKSQTSFLDNRKNRLKDFSAGSSKCQIKTSTLPSMEAWCYRKRSLSRLFERKKEANSRSTNMVSYISMLPKQFCFK
jgi:hypothetical protein